MSPANMFIDTDIRSIELSCRWCRVSYPSSRQRLELNPAPANSAKLTSVKPSFWKLRPPFNSCKTRAIKIFVYCQNDISASMSMLYFADRYPKVARVQYSGGRVGAHLTDELKFSTPPDRMISNLLSVTHHTHGTQYKQKYWYVCIVYILL